MMKFSIKSILLVLLVLVVTSSSRELQEDDLEKSSKTKSKTKPGGKNGKRWVTLKVTNLSFKQPFSSLFVMVHSSRTKPFFKMGEAASEHLQALAENGDPSKLVSNYTRTDSTKPIRGVASVEAIPGPIAPGETKEIRVLTSRYFSRLSLATMAVNTNDGFAAVSGATLRFGGDLYKPLLDAGTEENNELCASIPGPACPADADGAPINESSGNGEGFVHVHRGFHGVDTLAQEEYDWRNPIMHIEASGKWWTSKKPTKKGPAKKKPVKKGPPKKAVKKAAEDDSRN